MKETKKGNSMARNSKVNKRKRNNLLKHSESSLEVSNNSSIKKERVRLIEESLLKPKSVLHNFAVESENNNLENSSYLSPFLLPKLVEVKKSPTLISSISNTDEENTEGEHPSSDTLCKKQKIIKPVEENPHPNTDVNVPVNCFICNKLFDSFKEMQDHYLNTHKSKRKPQIKIKTQSDSNDSPSDTNTIIKPLIKPENKCSCCCSSFKSKLELKKHVKDVHSYVCSECKYFSSNFYEFTTHKCKKASKKMKKVVKIPTKNPIENKVANTLPLGLNRFVYIQPKIMDASSGTSNISMPVLPINRVFLRLQSSALQNPESNVNNILPAAALIPSTTASTFFNTNIDEHSKTVEFDNISNNAKEQNECNIEKRIQPKASCVPSASEKSKKKSSNETVNKNKDLSKVLKNPNISVTIIPNHTDTEYTCARCNVLCEDMADYIDHIEDCLHFSNVSFEPVKTPSQRYLKLKNEPAFHFKDVSNIPSTINRSLVKRLKSVVEKSDSNIKLFIKENTKVVPDPPKNNTSHKTQTKLVNQSFKDLLDDDNSLTFKEKSSLVMNNLENNKKKMFFTKLNCSHTTNAHSLSDNLREVFGNKKKGEHPMVVIPIENQASILNDERSSGAILKDTAMLQSKPIENSLYTGSPLSILLGDDDIKMEIEEEVVTDYF